MSNITTQIENKIKSVLNFKSNTNDSEYLEEETNVFYPDDRQHFRYYEVYNEDGTHSLLSNLDLIEILKCYLTPPEDSTKFNKKYDNVCNVCRLKFNISNLFSMNTNFDVDDNVEILTQCFNHCKFKCNGDEVKIFMASEEAKEEINHYSKLVKLFNSLSDNSKPYLYLEEFKNNLNEYLSLLKEYNDKYTH